MSSLKGALIGTGYFAQFHADGWNRISGVDLAAVADPSADRAKPFAAKWSIPHVYADATEMIRAEKPDFVDITTRPEAHLELTTLAAEHGVHVICQKPMAPTWDDCTAMVRLCDGAGVQLLMHENWRWQPWFREMKRVLDDGRLGSPYHVEYRMRTGDGRGPKPYEVQPYFREMERLLVYESAVHFLDTFRYLIGEIRTVSCRLKRVNPAIRGEDCALVHLEFENGALGLIDANRISGPAPSPVALGTCRVEGDGGTIRLAEDGRIFLAEHGKPEAEHAFARTDAGYKGDSVRATQEHLLECLKTGAHCESEGGDYLRTVAAVEACYESARSGQWEKPVENG